MIYRIFRDPLIGSSIGSPIGSLLDPYWSLIESLLDPYWSFLGPYWRLARTMLLPLSWMHPVSTETHTSEHTVAGILHVFYNSITVFITS